MTIIIDSELQYALHHNTEAEFFDLAKRLLQSGRENTTYVVFSKHIVYGGTIVTVFNNKHSRNGCTLMIYESHDNGFGQIVVLQTTVQRLFDANNRDQDMIQALIDIKTPIAEYNRFELPIFYSACIANHARIHKLFDAAFDRQSDKDLILRVYPKQLPFYTDAIKHFGSLNNVPEAVWRSIPYIADCYLEIFRWFYYDPTRPAYVTKYGPQLFKQSINDIESRVEYWIDGVAELLNTAEPAFTKMSDHEWIMIVAKLILHDKYAVTGMRSFGAMIRPRYIVRHPLHLPVYTAAIAALTE